MNRVILHSDCNSFYASVECLYHPELRDKPVAVGGDVETRRGIILAKNQIAKRYNIQTGETIWQAMQKCPNLVVLQPTFGLYSRFAQMARKIYLDYTDRVEPFGLDEAWLDITQSVKSAEDAMNIASEISSRIKYELGITVSIGISFNKIFAKLGSDYKKPDAITEITCENFKDIVYPLPCSELLGVGRATTRKLRRMGVHTIGDIAQYPLHLLEASFGKWGDILYCFARGEDTTPVALYEEADEVKSVGNSTTAIRDLECDEDARIIFTVLADSVSRRLREQGLRARVISISVRSNQLEWFTRQRKLDHYTRTSVELARVAMELFRANYSWSQPLRGLGICASDLAYNGAFEQESMFECDQRRLREETIDRTVDSIKKRFGTFSLQPAVLLTDRRLSGFDPKTEHTIHPESYF